MVSTLIQGSSGPGSNPGLGHGVVFLCSHSASLPPPKFISNYWVQANFILGGTKRK